MSILTGDASELIEEGGAARPKKGKAGADVDSYTGLSIRVSFTDDGESKSMELLSGGQKSLVALALIFALQVRVERPLWGGTPPPLSCGVRSSPPHPSPQRVDPAPFYLFDEVDAALDPTHRAAVAALIRKQAHAAENPSQIIATSFRSELSDAADAWFSVSMQNKVSKVASCTKAVATSFLKSMSGEEVVVGVDAVKKSRTG